MMRRIDPTFTVVTTTWGPPPSRVPRAFRAASAAMTSTVINCRGQNASTSTVWPGWSACLRTSCRDSVNIVARAAMEPVRMIQNSTQPQRNPAIRP